MDRDIFLNISPLDSRYYKSNRELMDQLAGYLSENSVIRYEAKVEAAIITVMERYGIVPGGSAEMMKKACLNVNPEDVYCEEEKTRHNIRALVNVLQRNVNENLAPFIHLSATSEDITGTAQALRMRDVFYNVVVPLCIKFMGILADISLQEADTPQIGRTHGQHAVPITVGFLFAGYTDRFGGRLVKIIDAVKELRGKMSGAVGAYNAGSLIFDDPGRFEKDVLNELGLKPAKFSSQIVEPEYMLDLVHAVVSAFGVLAQIGDDMRHLQRTEIAEMGEKFEKGQVGSSTMPHKRNPWNFEHVKSMWKEYAPRIITRYYDQISEHQRDLTNSASGRFVVEIITAFTLSVDRLVRQLSKLSIDRINLRKNIEATDGMFLAEPLYILLAAEGRLDAHEIVKQATVIARKEGRRLFEVIEEDDAFKDITALDSWKKLSQDPSAYTGIAEKRAREIAGYWKDIMDNIQSECNAYREEVNG